MPRNNELPSYESLLEFQEVYIRAIALAWNDDTFKGALEQNTEQALEDYFGYRCPWNIKLEVRDPDPDEQCEWKKDEHRWVLPRNTVQIGLPIRPNGNHRPASDHDCTAIALAAYNDAGPTYLFTCC